MFNIDLNSIQRVAVSAVAALVFSTTCIGMAVAPAAAEQGAPVVAVLSA
ncbi:hypothetical protein IC614_04265 [Allosphingosinicella flava]|uniref:Uncharacterized protein n=1 Tax=Allosphingosinicella flava TaxID=2771430 RepID=A0A7T2LMP6_9SPHN|nr:hypothetical protein [Sphingosinicella flava]QPQ55809.1 hypothetical protein IC614_04265 [Sphingosinicella flava]